MPSRIRRPLPCRRRPWSWLATLGECACKELGYYAGATSATLRRLEKLELLTLREQEVLPPPPPAAAADPKPLLLTPQQQAAYDSLSARLQDASPGTALLYGVTGSGKTIVYLRLIDDCLAAGRGAIVLVPEIALTPQLLRQFSVRYGARVAVLHSALRISERYETWKRIRSGDADVVLGTRSAVFAPVRDLGLLIVDEEQEHTYQSENAPRYHAREVAIYRGAQEHALTVLGSATPTVESMYRAVTGAFGLCRMTERYNGRPLPPVEIVDMKRELREGNASIISEPAAAGPARKSPPRAAVHPVSQPPRHEPDAGLRRMRQRPDVSGLQPAADVPPCERAAHVPHLRPQRAYACTLPRLRRASAPDRLRHAAGRGAAAEFAARRRRAAHGCRHRLGSQYP